MTRGDRELKSIDVRGTTVDESLDRLDAFLDHHYNSPTTHVRVIHGHGTGALRRAIAGLLDGHPHLMMPGANIQVYEALDIPGV